MTLSELSHAMADSELTIFEVAELLGIAPLNVNRKIAEYIPFTRDEMFALRDEYFPGVSIDYLFQSDGDVPTKAESLRAQVDAMTDAMRNAVDGDDPEIDAIGERFHECVDAWERDQKPAA